MIETDGVYLYEIAQLENGGEARGIVGNHVKIVLTGDNLTEINTKLYLTASYCDWQGNPLPEENRTIYITVLGSGEAQEIVLEPMNGQCEFDFISEVPGTFIIRATAVFPCDPAEIEVVVS